MSGLGHLPGALLLLSSFALLTRPRQLTMIALVRLQAVALTIAAFDQGFAQATLGLYLTGAIALAGNAVLVPDLLRGVAPTPGAPVTMPGLVLLLGLVLVGVAVVAVSPATAGAFAPARIDMTVALAVLLVGLLVMLAGRDASLRAVGLLSIGNGLLLAAIGLPGLPLTAALALALLAPPVLLLVAVGRGLDFASLRDRRR